MLVFVPYSPFTPVFCLVRHPPLGNYVDSAMCNYFEGLQEIYLGEAPVSLILKNKSTNKSSTIRVYPSREAWRAGIV